MNYDDEYELYEEKFNIKTTLIILLLCFCFGIIIFIVANLKNEKPLTQNLYLVNVRGYNLSNEFNLNIYEYDLVVNDNVIEISCEGDSQIEGCNVSLDLTEKEEYIHKIEFYDGKKLNTYTIKIKNETKKDENEFYIKNVEGNTFEWTNKDVTLEVIMSKEGIYLYSFDGGKTWQESNKLVVKENSKLELLVKDKTEKTTEIKSIEVDKIDKEKPQLTINKLNQTSTKITLGIVSYDGLSGIDKVSFNGGDFTTQTQYEITKEGTYYFEVKDKAGNISDKKYIEIKYSDFKQQVQSKTYTVNLNGNGVNIEKNKVSCTTTEDSCEVILPKIITNYTILGWGESNNSKEAKYTQGQKIKINKDLSLYAVTKITYTAKFKKNGATKIGSESLNCTAYNTEKCEITTPSITTNGEVIGWSENGNSKEASVAINNKIELKKDVNYYAITKRSYTAKFEKNGATKIGSESLNCTAYNTEKCEITTPFIIAFPGEIIGWSVNSNSQTSDVSINEKIELKKDVNYYAITKRTYTATFNKGLAQNISRNSLSCTAYNLEKCYVTTPTITATSGKVLGWASGLSVSNVYVGENEKLILESSGHYTPVIEHTYTATFFSEGLDYLEAKTLSCKSYSNDGCQIVLPYFNKIGHFNSFWSTESIVMEDLGNKTKLDTYFLQVGKPYTLTENIILYPNFNHSSYEQVITEGKNLYKFRKIITIESENVKYGQSIFEFESGLNILAVSKFKQFVSNLYNQYPWFFGPGKVFVVKRATMKSYVSALAYLSHTMNDAYFTVDLFDSADGKSIDQNSVIHEMAHSWDKYYRHKKGKRMCDLSEFEIVYNSVLDRLNPQKSGENMNKREAFANLFSIYYWHLMGNDTTKVWYGLEQDSVPLDKNQQKIVKDFMDKYISIAANGYK